MVSLGCLPQILQFYLVHSWIQWLNIYIFRCHIYLYSYIIQVSFWFVFNIKHNLLYLIYSFLGSLQLFLLFLHLTLLFVYIWQRWTTGIPIQQSLFLHSGFFVGILDQSSKLGARTKFSSKLNNYETEHSKQNKSFQFLNQQIVYSVQTSR